MASHQLVENRTFDEIEVGETASISRRLTEHDLASFAAVSGEIGTHGSDSSLDDPVAHGMLGGALISTVLGTRLPGPGTVYLRQELDFVAPMHLGDTITVTVKVAEKGKEGRLTLDCACVDQDGIELVDAAHSHAAAAAGAALAASGAVGMLMKGSLHTDELMAAVLAGVVARQTRQPR